MKKFIFILLVICFFIPASMPVEAENGIIVKVLYSSINIYNDSNISSEIITKSLYGTKLTLTDNNSILGSDGMNYYEVEVNIAGYTHGYVLCSQVLDVSLDSPKKDLDYNASINKEASTYFFDGNEYKLQENTIKSGSKIKILDGYDSSKEYTLIQYKNQDDDIVTTYIKTDNISVSGISWGTIGAIIIIITTISLVLIVFGIKGKRKKRN